MTKISREARERYETDLLAAALTKGSVVRNLDGGVSIQWMNDTGGRSSLGTIVDQTPSKFGIKDREDSFNATWCVERAIEMGILVVDYLGCDYDKVASWVIKGPMMLEPFEKPDEDPPFPAGSSLSKIDTYAWCIAAQAACGVHCTNIPAPRGWRSVDTSTEDAA